MENEKCENWAKEYSLEYNDYAMLHWFSDWDYILKVDWISMIWFSTLLDEQNKSHIFLMTINGNKYQRYPYRNFIFIV